MVRVRLRLPHPLAPGLPRMVTLSVVMHVVGGAMAIVLPAMLPRPAAPPWDDVLPGVLVDLPPAAPSPPGDHRPETASTATPRPEPEAPPPPPPEKKKKTEKKPPPVKKPPPEPVKREPAPKPAGETPGTKSPATTSGAVPAAGAAAAAGPGEAGIGLSFAGTSFGYSYYTAQLINKLRANWQRPVHPGPEGETLSVRLSFRISRQGQVSGVRVEVPSSSPTLDSSALRAVYAAAPFPPLPPQFTEDSLNVRITLDLKPSGL